MGACQNNKVDQVVIAPCQFTGLQLMIYLFRRITCKSWLKTYNNLFDYNTKDDLTQTILTIIQSTRIVKASKRYEIVELNAPMPQHTVEGIIDLVNNMDGSFQYRSLLVQETGKENQWHVRHLPWIVVKSLPSGKYPLKEGDIIRLGKQKVKVKEIILKDKQEDDQDETIITKHKIYNNLTKEATQDSHSSIEQQTICRVCLQDGQQNNPLIAPCKCIGSAKYIHLTCIQQWLTKSINPRTVNMAMVITWKPLVCELCSDALPFKIYLDGKKHFTVKIPRPKRPYLVLNPVYKDHNKAKVYFMVSFYDKNSLIMGRKKDVDIKVSDDASVSRHHTILTYTQTNGKAKFYIEDNNSKYGTLVFLKKNLLIKPNLSGLSLQIGGDLIRFQHGYTGQKYKKGNNQLQENINQSQSNSSDEQQESQEGVENPNNNQLINQNQQEQNHDNNLNIPDNH